MGLGPSTYPLPSTITDATTSFSPCLTPTVSAKPLTIFPTPSFPLKTPPPLYPKIPPSLITTPSTSTFPTHPHPTPTPPLTLLFLRQYRREQRVYPPLPSLRSARALLPTPSHRLAQHPSPDEPGPWTRPPHHPCPLLSPPSMYVGGGTRGLHGDVLSWILPTKSPTGETLNLSPIAHHRHPL